MLLLLTHTHVYRLSSVLPEPFVNGLKPHWTSKGSSAPNETWHCTENDLNLMGFIHLYPGAHGRHLTGSTIINCLNLASTWRPANWSKAGWSTDQPSSVPSDPVTSTIFFRDKKRKSSTTSGIERPWAGSFPPQVGWFDPSSTRAWKWIQGTIKCSYWTACLGNQGYWVIPTVLFTVRIECS